MVFFKQYYLSFLKFLYIVMTALLILSSIQFYNNAMIISSLFILNVLWIYKWNKKKELGKAYFLIYFIVTLVAIVLIKPVWESDHARYFIDGLHSLESMPVYKTIPSESKYSALFSQVWKESQYNDHGSIYPGLSVFFFKAVVYLSGADYPRFIYIFKIFALIVGLAIALLISKYKHGHIAYPTVILSMFHPLLILEWYINLHFDFLFAAVIFLLIYAKSQYIKIFALTLGFHIKYLIFLFLPVSSIKLNKIKYYIFFILCLIFTTFLYHSKGDFFAMINNTFVFGLDWEMNAGSFRLTRIFLSHLGLGLDAIKLSIFFQLCFLLTFLILHHKARKLTSNNFWLVIFVFIITSPVVNPWYLSWIIPLVLVSSGRSNYVHIITLPIYFSYSFYFVSSFQYIFYLEHLLFYVFLFLLLRSDFKEIHQEN